MTAKSNKAMQSRIRRSKTGSLIVSGKGRGHFNAKHRRKKKLNQKKLTKINISSKARQNLLIAK